MQASLDRFLTSVHAQRDTADDVEPDEIADPPANNLLRLALILEPYAGYVIHRRDRATTDLYVGRPTLWGNPFRLDDPDDETARLACVHAYAVHFAQRSGRQQSFMLSTIRRVLRAGGRLACHCSPRICHAQVLAAWALGRRITLEELEAA
jgi:hypothetical protein